MEVISEKLVWVVKNYFLIIGVASWFLIPYSSDHLPLLHRYSFLIPFALWLCKKEVAGSNGAVVVPQAAPAPMASTVENFYDFLFFNPQEEEEEQQQRRREYYCDVDHETSAASQGPAWWLSEPVLVVGKEAAVAEFSWDMVVDSTTWTDVAPSAPPIAAAYSATFFPVDECCGPSLMNKSIEEIWEAILVMKEEKGRRRRKEVKEEEEAAGGGRWKREVPVVKKDELFRQVDAFIKKQRQIFEFDLQREESPPVQRPRRAVEKDRRRQFPRP